MRSGEIRLYRAVREAVPVVDAAIYKLIRMVGGVTAACSDPAAERGLGEFLRTVRPDGGSMGSMPFWRLPGRSADLRASHRGDRARSREPGDCGRAVGPGGGY